MDWNGLVTGLLVIATVISVVFAIGFGFKGCQDYDVKLTQLKIDKEKTIALSGIDASKQSVFRLADSIDRWRCGK